MALDMVDGVQWFIMQFGQGFCGQHADQKRTDQSRSIGDGYGVDIVPGNLGFTHCLADDRIDDLDVRPRRYLWYDAAIFGMDIDLGVDHIRQQTVAVFNDGRRRFIAAAFNS